METSYFKRPYLLFFLCVACYPLVGQLCKAAEQPEPSLNMLGFPEKEYDEMFNTENGTTQFEKLCDLFTKNKANFIIRYINSFKIEGEIPRYFFSENREEEEIIIGKIERLFESFSKEEEKEEDGFFEEQIREMLEQLNGAIEGTLLEASNEVSTFTDKEISTINCYYNGMMVDDYITFTINDNDKVELPKIIKDLEWQHFSKIFKNLHEKMCKNLSHSLQEEWESRRDYGWITKKNLQVKDVLRCIAQLNSGKMGKAAIALPKVYDKNKASSFNNHYGEPTAKNLYNLKYYPALGYFYEEFYKKPKAQRKKVKAALNGLNGTVQVKAEFLTGIKMEYKKEKQVKDDLEKEEETQLRFRAEAVETEEFKRAEETKTAEHGRIEEEKTQEHRRGEEHKTHQQEIRQKGQLADQKIVNNKKLAEVEVGKEVKLAKIREGEMATAAEMEARARIHQAAIATAEREQQAAIATGEREQQAANKLVVQKEQQTHQKDQ